MHPPSGTSRRLVAPLVSLGVLAVLVVACSNDRGDDPEIVDRDPPAALGAAPPATLDDAGNVVTPVAVDDAGKACEANEVICNSTGRCMEACAAGCTDAPAECVLCPSSAGPALRTCVALNVAADGVLESCPLDRRCPCQTGGDCVGGSQVCVAGSCRACGERGTDGLECPNGRECKGGRCGR